MIRNRDVKISRGNPKSFANTIRGLRALQAPKSRCEIGEDGRSIIPLVARAGRSHVRRIARPV